MAGSLILALGGTGSWCGQAAPETAPVWVEWHFRGATRLSGVGDATALRAVLEVPGTQTVLHRAVDGLAGAAVQDSSERPMLRSWFSNLLAAESLGTLRGEVEGAPAEWLMAVRLGETEAKACVERWPALCSALGFRHHRSTSAGDWFLGGLGRLAAPDLQPLEDRVVKAGTEPLSPARSWLDLNVDLARLARYFGWPQILPWPHAQISVVGRDTDLRTTAQLTFDHPLDLPLGSWQIPTNSITEPLLSFTALQGVQPWLARDRIWQELDWPAPNQVFSWAQSRVPYETQFAWPMPSAAERIRTAAPRLPAAIRTRLSWLDFGQLELIPELDRLVWRGFPILVPFINPARDAGFVVAGIFPVTQTATPAPAELYRQVAGRTNLVYYHWEITQPRLEDWHSLDMIHAMVAGYRPLVTNQSVVLPWLQDTNMTRHLGNSVTEITRVSPRELQAVRVSAIGLTAFELRRLALWIHGEDFPRRTPPQPISTRRPATPTSP